MRSQSTNRGAQTRLGKAMGSSNQRGATPARTFSRRFVILLLSIGAGALVLRLIALAELSGSPLFIVLLGDAREYDAWAQRIAAGNWIGTEIFYQTPLYPYSMAFVFALFGHHVFVVRLLQCIWGATASVLLGLAGRRFFNARVGLVAALMLAVYPPAIFFDLLIQKASLDGFLIAAILVALGACIDRPRTRWLLVLGVALGVLTLNRENARVLYPIFMAWLLFGFRATPLRTRVGWASVATLAMALTLSPIVIRNYYVGGEFFLSTSQLGPNFYIGNHANAPGTYEPLLPERGNAEFERIDAKQLAEAARGRALTPSEVSNYWLSQGFSYIRSHPNQWLGLMTRKLALTFNAREAVDTESIEVYSEFSYVLRFLLWLTFGIVLPLAALGIWLTRREWRRLAVLYSVVAGLSVSVFVFYVMARYRYSIAPTILLFAAVPLSRLGDIRLESARRWIPGLILAIIVAICSNLPSGPSTDNTKVYLGSELIRIGQPAEAVPLLRQAIAALPDYAPAHFSLALALSEVGEPEQALAEYRTSVRLWPDDFRAQGALALALEEAGLPEEALDHFRDAARLQPDFGPAQNNLAIALHKAGKPAESIPFYESAIALNPGNAETHSNLALALAATGQPESAIKHFLEALRMQPNNVGIHMNFGDLLMDLARTPDALAQFQQAVSLAPQSPDTQARLAQAYERSGRFRDAIERFNIAISMARSDGQTDAIPSMQDSIKACQARIGRSSP